MTALAILVYTGGVIQQIRNEKDFVTSMAWPIRAGKKLAEWASK